MHKFLNEDEKIDSMMNNLSINNNHNQLTKDIPQTIPETNEEQKYGLNSAQYEEPISKSIPSYNMNNDFFSQNQRMNYNNPNPFGFGMMNESPNFYMNQQFPQGMDYMMGMGMANKYAMGMNPMNNMFMPQPNGFGMPSQFNQDPFGQFNPMYQQGNMMMPPQQYQPKGKKFNNNNNMQYMNNYKQFNQNKKMNNNKQKRNVMNPQQNMIQNNPYIKSAIENQTFDSIYMSIPDICKDHMGSKIFQKVYEEQSTPEQQQMIIDKIMPEVYNLSKDVFANYVIQRLLEIVTPTNKKKMIKELYTKIKELTLHMYGCRVIQKAIDVGDLEDIREHLSELKDELIKCVQDQNGNHVIQKLIEKLPKGEHSEIIKAVKNKVYQLSIHQYGCRAIQRIFEFCTEEEKSAVLKEIYPIVNDLCIDQYGNYVIQNIVEKIKDNQIIYDSITGKIYNYSIHKYASNVIESCLSLGNKKQVEKIVKEIIEQDDHNSDVLISLVRDKFGNYVVQKMIEVSEMKSKEILVKKIVSSQVLNKRDGFSKHVIMMIEKLGLTQLLHQEGMNNNSNYYKSTKGQ